MMHPMELQRTYRGNAERPEEERRSLADHGVAEVALIIASIPSGEEDEKERLSELTELLRTAGVEVGDVVVQHRDRPDPRTYLGKGRLEDVIEVKKRIKPDVIVAEGELTPGQQRHLEDKFKTRVVDRTAVILDIFAQHATSAEGKLQVELAQLEYSYARQEGLWQHLERLGGGVGTRGPGESQLESDRRMIRSRMGMLKRRLRETDGNRAVMRRQRVDSGLARVALAGYTNAGKSTLMNALTGADVVASDALFVTLDATVRSFEHAGMRLLVSDTVGFIRQLPHELVAAFHSTLDEVREANLILHVSDASETEHRRNEQARAVEEVLDQIGASEVPRLAVFNKIDRVDPEARLMLARRSPDAIFVSASGGEGLPALRERLGEVARARLTPIDVVVPYGRGDLVSSIYQAGRDVQQDALEHGARIRALLPAADAARILASLDAAIPMPNPG
jgi:GTPase